MGKSNVVKAPIFEQRHQTPGTSLGQRPTSLGAESSSLPHRRASFIQIV